MTTQSITGVLATGAHSFELVCGTPSPGLVDIDQASISAMVIGSG